MFRRCWWRRWCSGRRRARPPAISPHASLKARSGRSRGPPWPSGPSSAAARPRGQPCRHGNFACNSLLAISNFEFISLELQRFWVLLKVQATELHAKLGEGCVIGARLGCGGVLVRDFFAPLVVLVAEAGQNSPCWRKMGQKQRFGACWESFVLGGPVGGVCWESFIPGGPVGGVCWESFVPGMVQRGRAG